MALDGVTQGLEQLATGRKSGDAVELGIQAVEDEPHFKSVGFGGLPNAEGEFSYIAMNNEGEWGIATNVEFTFAVGDENHPAKAYIAYPNENKTKATYKVIE